MNIKFFTKLCWGLFAIFTLCFIHACGDKEKVELTLEQTMENMIIGKWEEKSSSDSNDYIGIEFKSDGTGVLWMDEEDEELYIGSVQHNVTVLVTQNGEPEKVIRIIGSFIDGKITTYLSISYITDKKLLGKMSYFDGDPLENEDDWFSVNFERVEEFSWEK